MKLEANLLQLGFKYQLYLPVTPCTHLHVWRRGQRFCHCHQALQSVCDKLSSYVLKILNEMLSNVARVKEWLSNMVRLKERLSNMTRLKEKLSNMTRLAFVLECARLEMPTTVTLSKRCALSDMFQVRTL